MSSYCLHFCYIFYDSKLGKFKRFISKIEIHEGLILQSSRIYPGQIRVVKDLFDLRNINSRYNHKRII